MGGEGLGAAKSLKAAVDETCPFPPTSLLWTDLFLILVGPCSDRCFNEQRSESQAVGRRLDLLINH